MKQIDHIVVDVGNSQCKLGTVQAGQILEVSTYALEDCAYQPWRHKPVSSLLSLRVPWTLSGSNPPIINKFADWLAQHQQNYRVVDASTPLPLVIHVDEPERVGRDRLLNALAVPSKPAIIISAGSAVTVDAVDADGAFLGGAIFPGLRLMAKSLHEYTAKLPMIDAAPPAPRLPGKNTEDAMHAGVVQAVVGGIIGCVNSMQPLLHSPTIYLTGGDGPALQPLLPWKTVQEPWLALQGILRIA
ncbi:MAG: type III pantothenate kinase [Gemmatales bacterium]